MVVRKLCYVIVVDDENYEDDSEKDDRGKAESCEQSPLKTSFWYTRPTLQSVLQLVGCKLNHAFKISRRVFDILEGENLKPAVNFEVNGRISPQEQCEDNKISTTQLYEEDMVKYLSTESRDKPYDLYKKQATVMVKRGRFLNVICSSLEEYRYVGPSQRDDIILACRLRERKESMTILLCGTSGCGKSTLSSLLASRLGITTVVSTDSIRHMMRSFTDENDNPLLWASTYHAGEFLDPVAVAEAKRKRKDRKLSSSHWNDKIGPEKSARFLHRVDDTADRCLSETGPADGKYTEINVCGNSDAASNRYTEQVGSKVLAVEGYKAQSEMVIDSLDRLITAWEDHKESVVVEGVHLSLNFVMGLMKKHPSIIPFLVYIADEEKHLERFAVRAKYMTLDPSKNKYVKYIRNIRTIQDYLCKRADKHLVPKVNNTNVDRSVACIHSTIFSCLRRRNGVSLYDVPTNTVKVINDEFCKHCDANSVGSKRMFRMIQRQGSVRRYMAIVNSDGSVAKAWPYASVDNTREITTSSASTSAIGSPIYGPVQIGEAQPVNLQFGNFGIGSWPNGTEGTSYTGSTNDSRVDGDEETTGSSSLSSSPSHQEGSSKELIEEVAASESDEEPLEDNDDDNDDDDDDDDDDDSINAIEEFEDELGGSVAESSTRSDDEYEMNQKDEVLEKDDSMESNSQPASRRLHKLSKCYSMAPSRKSIRELRPPSRVHSLPLQRSHSNKINNVKHS